VTASTTPSIAHQNRRPPFKRGPAVEDDLLRPLTPRESGRFA
jgi:hypothetical protein